MLLPGWKRRLRKTADEYFRNGQRDACNSRKRDPFLITSDGGPRWWSTVPRIAYDAGYANPTARKIPLDGWAQIVAERVCSQ